MEPTSHPALTLLRARLASLGDWVVGPGAEVFARACAGAETALAQFDLAAATSPVVVAYSEPTKFVANFLAAVARGLPVALASPRWGELERTLAADVMPVGRWLGDAAAHWPKATTKKFSSADWPGAIFIPTGGSGGGVKFAVHDWQTLATAARAQVTFLGLQGSTHVGTLAPWHVGGVMPVVRAIETGGYFALADWTALAAGTPPAFVPQNAVISLVPSQLQRLLEHSAVLAWLRDTRAVLLGGAAPTAELLDRARAVRLPIALAYGLTETAAAVAMQTPEEFLADEPPAATPLPHTQIWIGDDQGKPLPVGTAGRIWIETESLCHGYFPARRVVQKFATDDEGVLDARGRVTPRRRLDGAITTGAVKVYPVEIEQMIRASGLVTDVRVVGVADVEWGERVVAIYAGTPRTPEELRVALKGRAVPAMIPHTWIHAGAQLPPSAKAI